MNLPGPRQLLLFAASLSAGTAAGWALRQAKAPGLSDTAASAPRLSSEEAVAGSKAAEPFSMERFRAASGLPMHRMLAQVLPGADAALVRALAEQLAQRKPKPLPRPIWEAVFARWVQLEAPAALAWARTQGDDGPSPLAIAEWAKVDSMAALAATRAVLKAEWLELLPAIALTDPKQAFLLYEELLRKDPTLPNGENSLKYTFLVSWAAHDPPAALAYLTSHGPLTTHGPSDHRVVECMASGWIRKDPDACQAWLTGLPTAERRAALVGLMSSIPENPASIAKILGTLPPTDQNSRFSLQIAGRWAMQDAPAALTWVRQHFPEGPQRAEALARVAGSVMQKDLPAAVALMDEMGWDNGDRAQAAQNRLLLPGTEEGTEKSQRTGNREENWGPNQTIHSLLERLGQVDPELAVRCFEKTVAAGNPASVESFMPAWFDRQPESALSWLAAQPADKMITFDLKSLLKHSIELEPDAARDWALRLPPGPLQQALAAQSVADGILGDPAMAAEAIPFTDPATRRAALEVIIRDWSATSPASALDRLIREPTPMPDTCQTVLEEWTQHDPTAASTWVAAQPPGPNRDAAIRGLTTTLTDYDGQPDFSAALIWSLSMTDPAGRLQTAQFILRDWGRNGAGAEEMRTTLETTSALPETERQALLHLLKR